MDKPHYEAWIDEQCDICKERKHTGFHNICVGMMPVEFIRVCDKCMPPKEVLVEELRRLNQGKYPPMQSNYDDPGRNGYHSTEVCDREWWVESGD